MAGNKYIKQEYGDLVGTMIISLITLLIWYTNVIAPFRSFSLAMPILAGSLLLFVIIDCKVNLTLFQSCLPKSALIQLLYFVIMLPLGIMVSPSISKHLSTWLQSVEYFLISMMYLYYVITRNQIVPILWNIALVGFVLSLIMVINPYSIGMGTGRYTIAENVNPNGLAVVIIQGLWAVLCLHTVGKCKFGVTAIAVVVQLYAIILAGSRKGLTGAGIVIVLWILFCFINAPGKKSASNRLLKILAIVVVISIAAMVLLPYYQGSVLSTRMSKVSNEVQSGKRMQFYEMGYEDLKQSPLFGYGFGGFSFYHGCYSHATLVEVPVSSGIPMTLFYFGSYVAMFIEMLRKRKQAKYYHDVKADSFARMGLILFTLIIFYTTCLIHIYELSSLISLSFLYMISATRVQDNCIDATERSYA